PSDAVCPCPTGSTACGSTRPSRACSACRAPPQPTSSMRAQRRSTGAGGAGLDVELPAPPAPRVPDPEPVDGLTVIYDDDDIVVVDKPVGVAAHPSPGWTGPTVIGGLAAMGQRVATTGAAERQGVVHRLDVGT